MAPPNSNDAASNGASFNVLEEQYTGERILLPAESVKVVLRDPDTTKTHTVDRAPLTSENRMKVCRFHNRNR
jgi:hypothetical protein